MNETQKENSGTDFQFDNTNYTPEINKIFAENVKAVDETASPVFRVQLNRHDAYSIYLDSFKNDAAYQHRLTCSCCSKFFRRYAGLVTINGQTGELSSVLFRNIEKFPPQYRAGFSRIKELVEKAVAYDLFANDSEICGQAQKGGFDHYSFPTPARSFIDVGYPGGILHFRRIKSFNQHLKALLASTGPEEVFVRARQALAIFESHEALRHDGASIDVLKWVKEFSRLKRTTKDRRLLRHRAMAMAVTAKERHIHWASSVVAAFMKNLKDKGTEYAISEYKRMTAANNYMRPKTDPTESNVDRAAVIFKELNLEASLPRRCLGREEIPENAFVWKRRPTNATPTESADPFAQVRKKIAESKPPEALRTSAGRMTWNLFENTYLNKDKPTLAKSVEIFIPDVPNHYQSFMTAVNPEAPPILKHDDPNNRNTANYYGYSERRRPQEWKLSPGWNELYGITKNPYDWSLQEDRYLTRFLVLNTGHDTQENFIDLFPEDLIPELFEVRKTMEAYLKTSKKQNLENGLVAVGISRGASLTDLPIRVTYDDEDGFEIVVTLRLDRYE